ncbi:MAG: hypothetical protein II565_08315, partial [Fibrobacter sp.]|nr:hypothetical protein [Fibrobacter sp.]
GTVPTPKKFTESLKSVRGEFAESSQRKLGQFAGFSESAQGVRGRRARNVRKGHLHGVRGKFATQTREVCGK